MLPHDDQRAERQLSIQKAMLFGMFVVHLLVGLSTLLNVAMFMLGMGVRRDIGSTPFDQGRLVGNIVGFALAGLFSVAGAVWVPANLYALYKRRPWARKSTLAYWALTVPTLCCLPVGLYGLYGLSREDVKTYLARWI